MKKKFFIITFMALCLVACTDGLQKSIEELEDKYAELEGRVARLEELCKEMNTNISALKTLVSVIVNNDYIVSVTPITKDGEEVGYVMTFAIHDPITIYHGEDGKDGRDGITPVIGVALDTSDSAYYWTLNDTWLLDANGNRIPLSSRDGKDGEDGKDGQDGQDGKDGITPQLKIENDYWYVSTDNGVTWTQLGKAKGDKGDKGDTGDHGGDSMFTSYTEDNSYVYLALPNGTVLKVRKYKDEIIQIVDGAIMTEFSVSATKKVYFSMGNLQYNAMGGSHQCADGTTQQGIWRLAEHQWHVIGSENANISSTYDGWIDLFGWGTSGWNSGAVAYQPYSKNSDNSDYYPGNSPTNNLTGDYAFADWGVYNAISNGGNQCRLWRTLSADEWEYVMNNRENAELLRFVATVMGVHGLVILPDNWILTDDTYYDLDANEWNTNSYYTTDWHYFETHGAVFLPTAGYRATSNAIGGVETNANYWTTSTSNTGAYDMFFNDWTLRIAQEDRRNKGQSVRLVQDVQ